MVDIRIYKITELEEFENYILHMELARLFEGDIVSFKKDNEEFNMWIDLDPAGDIKIYIQEMI